MPQDTEVENVISFYQGMLELARLSGTAIVGGNMSGSPVIFADVNVIGKTGNPEGKYLSRSSAKPGDRIAVTGWLGTAAAGLEMLTHKLTFNAETAKLPENRFCTPCTAGLPEGQLLLEKGVKTGMDISDGLLSDLGHICKASKAGAIIWPRGCPSVRRLNRHLAKSLLDLALSGGEDYQLLFTAKPAVIESVRQAAELSCNCYRRNYG